MERLINLQRERFDYRRPESDIGFELTPEFLGCCVGTGFDIWPPGEHLGELTAAGKGFVAASDGLACRPADPTEASTKFVPSTGNTVTEILSTTQRLPVTSTLRATIGLPVRMVSNNVMFFATAGGAVGKVSGSFTYSANNFATTSAAPATAFGSSSWDLTRFGYAVGGGVTVRYPLVALTIEYLYTNLGTITENTPLVASGCVASVTTSCTSFAQSSMKTDTSTIRVKVGLPL